MFVKLDLKDWCYKYMLFYSNILYIDFKKNILIIRVILCLENVLFWVVCI